MRVAKPLVFGFLLLSSGCESRERPWDKPLPANAPPAVFTQNAGLLADGGSGTGSDGGERLDGGEQDADAAADLTGPAEPVRVGGPWVRCYGNFKPSGDPIKDVTRLGLLCGPVNGMRRLFDQAWVGRVAEGEAPVVESFQVKRGECFRIFAASETPIRDLNIAVKSSRDATIATDHGEDGWPIVQPDRPFCMLFDDTLRTEIWAQRGQGRFAAEVWVLPIKKSPD